MIYESPPFFEDALRRACERATEKLEVPCTISVHIHLDEKLLEKLEAIDHEKFRKELWYYHDDFVEKTKQKDFVCFILSVEGEPSAFLYGYDYSEDLSGFFLDEVVTRVEGKGIGKILIILLLIYCYELGYSSVTLFTEESDQDGRRLREFYEHIGFTSVTSNQEQGEVMNYRIEKPTLTVLYNRVMHSEGGPYPPYLKG